jgi:hypothetical protein
LNNFSNISHVINVLEFTWELVIVLYRFYGIHVNVVNTIGSEKVHLGANNELKILKAVESLGVGNINGRSCLKYLNDNWFRPPPGGAQTGTIVVSTISLKNNL